MKKMFSILPLIISSNAFAIEDSIAIINLNTQHEPIIEELFTSETKNITNIPLTTKSRQHDRFFQENSNKDGKKEILLKKTISKTEREWVIKSLINYKYLSTPYTEQALIEATKKIQKDLNIESDGIIGLNLSYNLKLLTSTTEKNTLKSEYDNAMSYISEKAVESKNKYYIVINIPSFKLHVFDKETNAEVMSSKVIIGRPERETPIFETNIVSVKYNPEWNPPPGIISKDILPSLEEDGDYLKEHKLFAYDSEGNVFEGDEITSEDVQNYGLKFMQAPGKDNALGVLKFETDNDKNIYLHDTNQKSLFSKTNRAFSSGCIRVQNYKELAALLLGKDIDYINKNIDKDNTFWEKVQKTKVFIIYSQAWPNNGFWSFYYDIYSKKQTIKDTLATKDKPDSTKTN